MSEITTVFLVTHKSYGISLGDCLGMSFWTKVDPVGQPAAFGFATRERAQALIEEMIREEHRTLPDFAIVGAQSDVGSAHCSITACVRAGLQAWDPEAAVV